jgi:hypothetical protein
MVGVMLWYCVMDSPYKQLICVMDSSYKQLISVAGYV